MSLNGFARWFMSLLLAACAAVLVVFLYVTSYWPDSPGLVLGLLGDGISYTDAYVANGQTVDRRRAPTPEEERLRLALAEVDSPKPVGESVGSRLHTPPVLAHLKYDTLDDEGRIVDSWQLRALVPPSNHEPSVEAVIQCKQVCRDALARRDATQIVRDGDAGIAAEWVLRLALSKPTRLPSPPTNLQDLFDERGFTIPLVASTEGEARLLRQPTVQVTLVGVCPAQVSIAKRKEFQIAEFAILPVITGMRTMQWTELRGCGKLLPLVRQRALAVPVVSATQDPAPSPPPYSPAVEPAVNEANAANAADATGAATSQATALVNKRGEVTPPLPIAFDRLITLTRVPQATGAVEIPPRRGRSDLPNHRRGCVPGFDEELFVAALALAKPTPANDPAVRAESLLPWCTVHYATPEGRARLDLYNRQRGVLTLPDGRQGLISILIGFNGRPVN